MENKEPDGQGKKLSRTTLTFYIVALFSVAIALIMISYVAQSRANRQLESLSTQLSEQQNATLGVSQKMENLQSQFDNLNKVLDKVRNELGNEQAKTDIAGAARTRMEERKIYAELIEVYSLLLADKTAEAKEKLDGIQNEYGEERLTGESDNSFSQDIAIQFSLAREKVNSAQELDTQTEVNQENESKETNAEATDAGDGSAEFSEQK